MTFQTKRRIDYWLGGLLLAVLFVPVRLLGLALRRNHTLVQRRGCAVIKLVGAGSLFLAMPSLQAIRGKFPAGKFILIGTPAVTGFARSDDFFDKIWTIDDSSFLRLFRSILWLLPRVAANVDHLIDLEVHSRFTTVFTILSMVRNRIGFVDEIVFWRRAFYTHMTYFNVHGPVYAFYDLLAGWFDIARVEVSAFHAGFRRRVMCEALPEDLYRRRFVAIGHACSDLGRERQLLPSEWLRLLQEQLQARRVPVFLGGRDDAALADRIIGIVGAGINLCGVLSFAQSARVIADADEFLGIDSLLLHLARALGVPCVSVWGPTDPTTLLRPIRTPERVSFARIPCAPCIHVNETPPCGGRRTCMALAVETLLRPSAPAPHDGETVIGWDVDPHTPRSRPVTIAYG